MANPSKMHWVAMKWLLRHLNHTDSKELAFKKTNEDVELLSFMDSNFVGNKDKRMYITTYVFTFCGNLMSWKFHL